MKYDKELEFAKSLALEAGEVFLKYFRSSKIDSVMKSDKTVVTKADTEINDLVISRVQDKYPGHDIWGEEKKVISGSAEFTWVCDPVDGTMPYSKGIPISSFSLALVNSDGRAVVGVVYDPFCERLFYASLGAGAFLNGNKISVTDKADFDCAYIDLELWINQEEGVAFDDPKDFLAKSGAKVTTQCSATIMGAFVASGTYDAMIFGQGKPEDIAALSVIVSEAGGKVTNLFGETQRYDTNIVGAIVSNGALHDKLVEVLQRINYKSKYMK